MAIENITDAFGIPIPSTDPMFLGLVGIHVMFGLAAVASGAVAMLSRKGPGRHATYGAIYFWSLSGLVATMSALSFMRWPANSPLFIVGTLSFASAYFGRAAALRRWRRWPALHLVGMGASYILTLTGFYVDNGTNLPLWKDLPSIALWLIPGILGIPLILYALFRHPLVANRAHVQGL